MVLIVKGEDCGCVVADHFAEQVEGLGSSGSSWSVDATSREI